MRIISKFNDYYDSVQAHGQDLSVIYQRSALEYPVGNKDNPEVVKELENIFKATREKLATTHFIWTGILGFDTLEDVKQQEGWRVATVFVIFCGVIYAGLKTVKYLSKGTLLSAEGNTHYFYDGQSFARWAGENKINLQARRSKWGKQTKKELLDQFYTKNVDVSHKDWLIENKVSVVLKEKEVIVVNPCLKNVEFFKVYDAYVAYQELDMWISGTLAYPQNICVEIEDKYKIMEHGFDKWSFRKMPEKS